MFKVIDTRHVASAHAQGKLYGSLCRDKVHHSVQTYTRLFAACGIDWSQACAKALAMQPAIRALDPCFLEEMTGIAEGAGLGLADILALNCRTEILPPDFLNAAPQAVVEALEAGECTAVALQPSASSDGKTWLAQNWDWIGAQREALVLLRGHAWTPDAQGQGTQRGREFVTLTEGGMLAKIGLGTGPEEDRVAVGLNIIRSRYDGEKPAVPVHPLLRHLMTQPSLAAIRARMGELGQQYGFGAGSDVPCADTAGEVAAFEVSPRGWQEWPPENGVMTHTNHYLCEPLRPLQQPTTSLLSSEPRLRTARRHTDTPRPLGRQAIEDLLRDESDGLLSICRHPNPEVEADARVESVAGVIINIDERSMWVADNVPSKVPFERLQ